MELFQTYPGVPGTGKQQLKINQKVLIQELVGDKNLLIYKHRSDMINSVIRGDHVKEQNFTSLMVNTTVQVTVKVTHLDF